MNFLRLFGFSVFLFFSSINFAQTLIDHGGGKGPATTEPCLSNADYDFVQNEIQSNIQKLSKAGKLNFRSTTENAITKFSWPLKQAAGFDYFDYYATINYVDLDPSIIIQDYNCGDRSYNGHNGLDISLWPFWWKMMEEDQVEVIASAPGQIVFKQDGNFDRNCNCHGTWNAVYVQHADGSIAWYGHLKTGSLTNKTVGDAVVEGDYIGIVGSSGCSSNPHLHFEIRDANQNVIDPYQGNCNGTISESWWQAQKNYREPALNYLMTHLEVPAIDGFCPNEEFSNFKTEFQPGDVISFSVYYHDQLAQDQSSYRIKDPSGNTYVQWDHAASGDFSSSYWYWTYSFPSSVEQGTWLFEVQHQGNNYAHEFTIGLNVNINELPTVALELFPNPASSEVWLKYNSDEMLNLEIYNQHGEQVMFIQNISKQIQGINNQQIDLNNQSSGLYIFQLKNDYNQVVAREKMIVIK